MRIWHYDTETLILIHSGESYADPNPRSPGMFLVPAGATPIEPIPEAEGKTRHFDQVSSVWFYRDVPPAPPEPDPKDLRRVEIIGRLYAIDAASVRPQREVIAALAAGDPSPAYAVDKLAALEAESAQLRTELAGIAMPVGDVNA